MNERCVHFEEMVHILGLGPFNTHIAGESPAEPPAAPPSSASVPNPPTMIAATSQQQHSQEATAGVDVASPFRLPTPETASSVYNLYANRSGSSNNEEDEVTRAFDDFSNTSSCNDNGNSDCNGSSRDDPQVIVNGDAVVAGEEEIQAPTNL